MQINLNVTQKQSGAVLLTSLVILLVLTLLGLNSMQTTVLEERMAGNFHSRDLALNAAESALREAESIIGIDLAETVPDTKTSKPTLGADEVWDRDTTYTSGAQKLVFWWNEADDAWWSTNGESATYEGNVVAEAPLYITEYMGQENEGGSITTGSGTGSSSADPYHYFRITARGTGREESSKVMLQSIFRRKFADQ